MGAEEFWQTTEALLETIKSPLFLLKKSM